MWAFNFLAAVGIIALILVGFFVLMSLISPKDVADVKATAAEINTGAGLINIFRIKGILDSPVNCTKLKEELTAFYGEDMSYVLTVDDDAKCSKGKLKKPIKKLEIILPDYEAGIYNIVLEVSQ